MFRTRYFTSLIAIPYPLATTDESKMFRTRYFISLIAIPYPLATTDESKMFRTRYFISLIAPALPGDSQAMTFPGIYESPPSVDNAVCLKSPGGSSSFVVGGSP